MSDLVLMLSSFGHSALESHCAFRRWGASLDAGEPCIISTAKHTSRLSLSLSLFDSGLPLTYERAHAIVVTGSQFDSGSSLSLVLSLSLSLVDTICLTATCRFYHRQQFHAQVCSI